jgi:hypothetical protein
MTDCNMAKAHVTTKSFLWLAVNALTPFLYTSSCLSAIKRRMVTIRKQKACPPLSITGPVIQGQHHKSDQHHIEEGDQMLRWCSWKN